jgi:hypothetical protein
VGRRPYVEAFRHLGQRIWDHVQELPERRPSGDRRDFVAKEESTGRVGGDQAEQMRPDEAMEHREIMLIVATVVALLALALFGALFTLGFVFA